MNYHSDEWIRTRIKEHYKESLQYFPESQIVGVFYQKYLTQIKII